MSYADQASAVGAAADSEIAGLQTQLTQAVTSAASLTTQVATLTTANAAQSTLIAQQAGQIAILQAQIGGAFPQGKTLLGVALGADLGLGTGLATKALAAYETWWGRSVEVATDYLYDDLGTGRFGQYTGTKALMVWSVQGCPKGSTLANVIAGKHDAAYLKIATDAVANGFGHSVFRLNWEVDGGWMPGGVLAPGNTAAQVSPAFRRVVGLWRTVPGFKGLIEFNCGRTNGFDLSTVYPGDDVVDVIGTDCYDRGAWFGYKDSNGKVYTAADHVDVWKQELQPVLDFTYAFAQLRKKPMSVSEWGCMISTDGHGGGDDPYYLQQFAAWAGPKWIAYMTMFNGWDGTATARSNNCRLAEATTNSGPFKDSTLFPQAIKAWKSPLFAVGAI